MTRVEIASRGALPGVVLAINSEGRLRPADRERVKAFLTRNDHETRGVLMWGRGWKRQWGDTRRRHPVGPGLEVETAGGAFGQVNTRANLALVAEVVRQTSPRPGRRVLELYAGAGNFTLALAAAGAEVVAVEADADAVEAGQACLAHYGFEGIRFVRDRAERFLTSQAGSFDAVLLNPPRSGASREVIDALGRLRIPRLVYVSCNPATLARDVRLLAPAGYRLEQAVPVDMFPHTYHVEVVCGLTCS